MAQEQVEEYLETIYDLEARDGSAKTTGIAKCLKVAPASVTQVLKSLSDKGFIQYEPYRGATLTEEGKKIADTIKRKHRLLEVFLTDVLKLNREKVHDEACRMEHTISEDTENALCRMMNAPARCPHGSPISPCNMGVGSCAECDVAAGAGIPDQISSRNKKVIPVTELTPDQNGKIAFIRGDCKVVQRLSDLGLTLGTKISLLKKTPMEGPVEILVRRTRLAIDHTIAENIFIEPPVIGEP
ncbi:MAG: metal-dependent transcriptional regulator [Methanoregula sp.]|nr:metal-dependent transcriptional regulator [Methanoregula sp.]